ncbi:MAG: hypothetical protein GY939_28220 [Actinomycetia bacterium]|nr:hypothetical protein [Actinomycetes bacterium]
MAMRVVNHVLMLAIACLVLVAVNTARTLELAEGSVVESPFQWDHETPIPPTTTILVPTIAGGPTTWPTEAEDTTSDPRAAARGAEALARISYPWREHLPGWEIRFFDARDGAYGYTMTQENRIDIHVRDDQSDHLLTHVVAHEIGHAVDVALNSSDDRDRWKAARGIEDAPWWPDNRAADFATGAGDFAESFASWQVGPEAFRSQLGGAPTADQQALLADLASK